MKTKEEKKALLKKHSPHSPILKNSLAAFFVGGTICLFGEVLLWLFSSLGLSEKTSLTLVTISLILIAGALTGLGVFDRIAKRAGAGTLLPVTGFSNAVVSEAMDASNEGFVLGVGAKIFTVAGPVILFGLFSGVVYGAIYYFLMLIM